MFRKFELRDEIHVIRSYPVADHVGHASDIPCVETSDPKLLCSHPVISVHMITCNHEPFIRQANKLMNDTIAKKLKLDPAKVPSSLWRFGNTSSASIPLTLVTELKGKVEDRAVKFLCCGFGVGLFWGTVAFETNRLIVSPLVEVPD